MSGDEDGVALPLVYGLLSSKETWQYAAVLRSVQTAAREHLIENFKPGKIMGDFEKAIINACTEVFPEVPVTCCFFHLGQSVYRKIQSEGLQQAYNDPLDRAIKMYTHMMLALAYVPVDDVLHCFTLLKDDAPDDFIPILDYFEQNYVLGRPGRGRRKAVPPRYPAKMWNQHEAALDGSHKTNNVSEGWHNRFRLVVGKHHPDLYSALNEFQKEQADTEIAIAELSLGRMVKAAPKKKWLAHQNRIRDTVTDYELYKNDERLLDFLKSIAYNVVL